MYRCICMTHIYIRMHAAVCVYFRMRASIFACMHLFSHACVYFRMHAAVYIHFRMHASIFGCMPQYACIFLAQQNVFSYYRMCSLRMHAAVCVHLCCCLCYREHISIENTFYREHILQRTHFYREHISIENTFYREHILQRTHFYREHISTENTFYRERILQRTHFYREHISLENTFCREHILQRTHSIQNTTGAVCVHLCCTIECVLLLQNVFSYNRMCSLTIECVLLLGVDFVNHFNLSLSLSLSLSLPSFLPLPNLPFAPKNKISLQTKVDRTEFHPQHASELEVPSCVNRSVCTIECVLLLQNVFSYYRMCSLTIECVRTWRCQAVLIGLYVD